MSLYVYCVGDDLPREAVEGLSGISGVRVRLMALGRLSAVVSEFDGESVAVTSENLRAHNAVNARVLACVTPLPFRFGTLASESRLAEYTAANEGALVSALGRVRGCVEMGVKIRWDVEKAKGKRQRAEDESVETDGEHAFGEDALTSAANGAEAADGAEIGAASVGSGTAFLLAKRREALGDEGLRRRAEEVAAWLAGGVAELARESRVRVNSSDALVVRAAHLVERARVEEYRGRVRELGVEREGLHFLTSGPWPPYGFGELSG